MWQLIGSFFRDPVKKAVLSLIFHLCFAFYNGILGILSGSRIFIASGIYYLLLSVIRFITVITHRRQGIQAGGIGGMLIGLSFVMGAVVFISIRDHTAALRGTIPMITIAAYTFTKITMAVMATVKQRGGGSKLKKILSTIRLAEVAVSLLTMQQSMLVSFEGMEQQDAYILNIFTGAAVCLFILALGIHTIAYSRKEIKNGK